jgi:hypothetical protein
MTKKAPSAVRHEERGGGAVEMRNWWIYLLLLIGVSIAILSSVMQTGTTLGWF